MRFLLFTVIWYRRTDYDLNKDKIDLNRGWLKNHTVVNSFSNEKMLFSPTLPVCKLRLNRAPSSCILTWQNNELSALNPFSRLWIMGTGLEVTRTDWVNWQSSWVLFSIASNPERSEAVGSNTQTSPFPVTLTRLPANGLDCVAITEFMPIGKKNKRTFRVYLIELKHVRFRHCGIYGT